MKNLLLLLLVTFTAVSGFGQTVDLTITGIRKTTGSVRLKFYTSSENFDKDVPTLVKTLPKTGIKNGTLTVSYTLKAGLYGIAILDDENNNKEMDYGLVLPKEGFGFSDYYHTGMSHPTFDQFDFYLKNETKAVKIKLRYL